MRFALVLMAVSVLACQSPRPPQRVLPTGVASTSVAELLSVPEVYNDIWVQFLGWSLDGPFGTRVYLSRDHAEHSDHGAAILVAPHVLPDEVPCNDMLVYIEGTFGVIPDYARYGLTNVRRLWSAGFIETTDDAGLMKLETECSWWNDAFPPPNKLLESGASQLGVGGVLAFLRQKLFS